MKLPTPSVLLMTELRVLMYNIRYAIRHYFCSHLIFMMPINIYIVFTGDRDSSLLEFIAYSCLVTWFAYGLYRTRQRKFVATIGVLFIWSQYALYAEQHTLDIILTTICVMLMCIKQYVNRYHFAMTLFIEKNSAANAKPD